MRPRFALPLLVALALCATAGCTGVFETHHGAPSFAPGVSEERVTNASALADAHRAVLANTSETYVSDSVQRVGPNYTVTHRTRAWVAANGSFLYRHRGVVNSTAHSSDFLDGLWANGTVAVIRTVNVSNGTVTYARYRPPEPFSAANATWGGVGQALGDTNAAVTQMWNASGHSYARAVANETLTRRTALANGSTANVTMTHRANATVRDDGLVATLNASNAGRRPSPDSTRLIDYGDESHVRYTDLGTTMVREPAWVATALNATAGLSHGEETAPRTWNGSVGNASV